jgi:hypothetical protein
LELFEKSFNKWQDESAREMTVTNGFGFVTDTFDLNIAMAKTK